jgi:hypothetical protein
MALLATSATFSTVLAILTWVDGWLVVEVDVDVDVRLIFFVTGSGLNSDQWGE